MDPLPREEIRWCGTALLACSQPPLEPRCCPSPNLPGRSWSSCWHLLRRGRSSSRYVPAVQDADWYPLLEPSNISIACACLPGKRLPRYDMNKDSSAVPASCNGSEVSWLGLCRAGAGAAVQCGCDLQQVPVAPRGAASRTLCCKGS